MHYKFYAVFIKEKDSPDYNVIFPNIVGGRTCGVNYQNAIYMANDLLKMMLEDNINNAQHPLSLTLEQIKEMYPEGEIKEFEIDIDDKFKKPNEPIY